MADIKNITIDGTTYDLKDDKARTDVSDLKEDITDIVIAFNSSGNLLPSKIEGFTGDISRAGLLQKVENSYAYKNNEGKLRIFTNNNYDLFIYSVTEEEYSFTQTPYYVVTDAFDNVLYGVGDATNITSMDFSNYTGARKFYMSVAKQLLPVDGYPVFYKGSVYKEGELKLEQLVVDSDNYKDGSVTPLKFNGFRNNGNILPFLTEKNIISGKYVYNSGTSIKWGTNAGYTTYKIQIELKKYYMSNTSWWVLVDASNTVLLGCGNSGTSITYIDIEQYPTAKYFYMSTASSVAYFTENESIPTLNWTIDGLDPVVNNNVYALPNIKYINGSPMDLYHIGGWLRESKYNKSVGGGGQQFADHFSYQADTTGDRTVTITNYNDNYDIIGKHSFILSTTSPNYRNLKALFIGDSTINNGTLTAKVLSTFADNNVTCTLLGTTGSGDNKREGRSGWSAKDYCGLTERGQDTAQNPFYNPSTETFDFTYYMTQQGYATPDFVFIQLGINDMFGVSMDGFETGYNTFKTNMLTIVNSIHDYNSGIKVVVNLITMPGTIEKFNQLYGTAAFNFERRYVDVKTNSNLIIDMPNYVLFAPHNVLLDPNTMISDDVHPTPTGYNVLGEFDANFMFAN